MANIIAEEMEQRGVHFIHQAKPKAIEKQDDGRLLVHWVDRVRFHLFFYLLRWSGYPNGTIIFFQINLLNEFLSASDF